MLWAALRRDQRETATVVILACFAVWGTLAGGGPFARSNLNDSFLLLVMFFISISVPSLALSADVLMRRRSEENLPRANKNWRHAPSIGKISPKVSANPTRSSKNG